MKRLIRYLFPKRSPRQKLPLPPRRYSSGQNPWGDVPDVDTNKIIGLIARGVARTPDDGLRLLRRYPDLTVKQIVKREKKQRKFWGGLARAWQRVKRLW